MANLKAQCSNCDKVLKIPKLSLAGKLVRCTGCGEPVRVPELEEKAIRKSKSKAKAQQPNPRDDEWDDEGGSKPRRRLAPKSDNDQRPRRKRGKKSNSQMILILSGVGVVVLIGAVFGVLWATGTIGGNSNSNDEGKKDRVQANSKDAYPPGKTYIPPSFSGLKAEEFYNTVTKGTPEEKNAFRNKTIEMMGYIRSGMIHGEHSMVILSGGSQYQAYVFCSMKEKEPWLTAAPPGRIIVKGRWDEQAPKPTLMDCDLVKTFSPPPKTYTADELVNKFVESPNGARQEFKSTWFILTGAVEKNEQNRLVLSTNTDKAIVRCSFSFANTPGQEKLAARFRKCTPGTKVKIIGPLSSDTTKAIPEYGVFQGIILEPSS